eukprot:7388566-Prymnesium_polylepis.1
MSDAPPAIACLRQTAAKPTEAKLYTEFCHDPYAKALLLIEMAPYRPEGAARDELLEQVAHEPLPD